MVYFYYVVRLSKWMTVKESLHENHHYEGVCNTCTTISHNHWISAFFTNTCTPNWTTGICQKGHYNQITCLGKKLCLVSTVLLHYSRIWYGSPWLGLLLQCQQCTYFVGVVCARTSWLTLFLLEECSIGHSHISRVRSRSLFQI